MNNGSKLKNTKLAPFQLNYANKLLPFEHFSYTKLKNNLNISETLLYRWSQEHKSKGGQLAAQNKEQTQETEFIELPPACHHQDNGILLELSVNNQYQMRLSGHISTQQLDVVTRNIFMYQSEQSS